LPTNDIQKLGANTLMTDLQDSLDIIETTDENGQVHIFERVDEIEVDGRPYALLVYRGAEGESQPEGHDEEVVVMRVSQDPDGTDVFEQIEDEAEFEKVLKFIEAMDDGEFEIVDDEDDTQPSA
jgi:uncharacterized protein YrzB (UPF0473 family)